MSASAPPAAYFGVDGDQFVPSRLTQGPWGEQLSGTFIGGMLAYAVERDAWDPGFHPTRFTVDLLRPVALAPFRLRTTVVRAGRRLRLVDSEIVQSDTVVARASTLFLRPGEQPPGDVWTTPVAVPPLPTRFPDTGFAGGMAFWIYGEDFENPSAGPDFQPWQYVGPKHGWVRELAQLVDGVALTPFTRAALAGDITSSLTQFSDAGLYYINPDYTLTLTRLPDGTDIGLTAVTHYSHAGIATGVATLFDRHGPIGSALATGLAHGGFQAPSS
ncbi:thioesterase family protein [Mycolicibacterium thermoresistibile]